MSGGIYTYENFCLSHEVTIYKRVKRRAMKLGEAGRIVISNLLGAPIGDGTRSDKQFIQLPGARYRIATSRMSDNSTEAAAHLRMGVETIYAGEEDSVIPFLRKHGCPISWQSFVAAVGRTLQSL